MLSGAAAATAGAALGGLPELALAQDSAGALDASEARAPTLPKAGASLALRPVLLLDGSTFDPEKADGKVLVVYWWASWCPFCAVQSPHIEALWRKNRARGLEVLALSIDKRREDALAYLQKKGYAFPAGMLTAEVATMLPKPKGLPVTVVRGRNGKVVWAEGGEMFPEDIEGLAKYL
jgi:thiol-disulfide isomerase/thioredoxin